MKPYEQQAEIGQVSKLAPGAVNPMWAIESGLEDMAMRGVMGLELTKPREKDRALFVVTEVAKRIKREKEMAGEEDIPRILPDEVDEIED